MNSPKRLARIAGVLYLLVGIFGGFAQGYLYPKIYVAGDAGKTAANVIANSGLVRAGVVSDLFQATVWVFLAIALYQLLKHVNKEVAGAMVVLAAMGATITMLNSLFEFEALRIATGAVRLATLGAAGSTAMVQLLVDAQHNGLLIASIFMGLWLAPLGYLAYRSGMFPRSLGVVLVAACAAYLVDFVAAFLVPDFGKSIHGYLIILPTIAEPSMLLYLLITGVRTVKTSNTQRPILAAA